MHLLTGHVPDVAAEDFVPIVVSHDSSSGQWRWTWYPSSLYWRTMPCGETSVNMFCSGLEGNETATAHGWQREDPTRDYLVTWTASNVLCIEEAWSFPVCSFSYIHRYIYVRLAVQCAATKSIVVMLRDLQVVSSMQFLNFLSEVCARMHRAFYLLLYDRVSPLYWVLGGTFFSLLACKPPFQPNTV